jgi:hypothetical protein
MNATEMFVAVLIPLGFFLLVFGVVYMFKKENLAMIEKGMNPKQRYSQPAPYKNLKWALLLVGAGSGLFVAYLLDDYVLYRTGTYISDGITHHYRDHDNPAIYFALIAIGGGLGLFGSYRLEKKWMVERLEKDKD